MAFRTATSSGPETKRGSTMVTLRSTGHGAPLRSQRNLDHSSGARGDAVTTANYFEHSAHPTLLKTLGVRG